MKRLHTTITAALTLSFATPLAAADSVINPCEEPLPWRIGEVDPRFGLEEDRLAREMRMAARSWNDAAGKTLLVQDEHRGFPIHLRWDERQQRAQNIADRARALEELQERVSRQEDRLRFDEQRLERDREAFQADLRAFERALETHNQRVAEANRGRPTAHDSNALRQQSRELERQQNALQSRQHSLNDTASELGTRIDDYNQLVARLNQGIDDLNRQLAAMPAQSGEYRATTHRNWRGNLDRVEREIEIYFFYREQDLRLTLIHELGHALGLDHADEPEAIMHASYTVTDFSDFTSPTLHPTDIQAIHDLCE